MPIPQQTDISRAQKIQLAEDMGAKVLGPEAGTCCVLAVTVAELHPLPTMCVLAQGAEFPAASSLHL